VGGRFRVVGRFIVYAAVVIYLFVLSKKLDSIEFYVRPIQSDVSHNSDQM
jgi:hypothetical protein